ncbi:MAG: hypothetical protein R3F62_32095 [Planctomycetota bacterium]
MSIYAGLGLGLGVLVFVGAIYLATRAGARAAAGDGWLCDRCKYNDPRYCSQPDRPNATTCGEFKQVGT